MDYKRMSENGLPAGGFLPQPIHIKPGESAENVVIVQGPGEQLPKAKGRPLIVIGSVQVAFGILLIAFSIGTIMAYGDISRYGEPGLWSGVLAIVTGGIGIGAYKRMNRCMVTAYLVLAIVTSIAMCEVILAAVKGIHEGFGGEHDDGLRDWRERPSPGTLDERIHEMEDFDPNRLPRMRQRMNRGSIAMNALVLTCGIVECFIAIIAACVCCALTCCPAKVNPSKARYVTGQRQFIRTAPEQIAGLSTVPPYGSIGEEGTGKTVDEPALPTKTPVNTDA